MVLIIPDSKILSEETAIEVVLQSLRLPPASSVLTPADSEAASKLNQTDNRYLTDIVREVDLLYKTKDSFSRDDFTDKIKSIRMRVLTCCLGLDCSIPNDTNVKIHTASSVFSYCIIDSLVIALPETIQNSADERQMLYDFELLFDKTACRYKWIIDCSGFKTFSGLLFGNLIYYQDRLRESGQGMYLYWLKPDLLKAQQMQTLIRVLNLIKIGGQYFSSDQFSN